MTTIRCHPRRKPSLCKEEKRALEDMFSPAISTGYSQGLWAHKTTIIGTFHLQMLACFHFHVSEIYIFPKHCSFLINPACLLSTMFLRVSQTSCKVLGHRSTWLPSDVGLTVLNLGKAFWSPCLDKIVARPFSSILPDSAFPLLPDPLPLTENKLYLPFLLYLHSSAIAIPPFGSPSCLDDTSHRAFIQGNAHDSLPRL